MAPFFGVKSAVRAGCQSIRQRQTNVQIRWMVLDSDGDEQGKKKLLIRVYKIKYVV